MSHDDLLQALDLVHRELEESEHLDSAQIARLRATMDDIQTAIAKNTEHAPTLSERVSESATEFETSHPRLTNILGRVADMLQQMGI